MRRVEALKKLHCRKCAEARIRMQAAALTDPDGKPLLKNDLEAFVERWLLRIASRPQPTDGSNS